MLGNGEFSLEYLFVPMIVTPQRRLRKKLSTVPELSDFILPIYAECRARYFHPDDYYTMGRLVLSSYCNQKDLKRYIKKNNKKNKVLPHFVLKVMLLLIEKISIILAHGFISTDLKLSNILVNENPDTQAISLHISDCKSFQQYDTNTGVLNYTNIIVTADHRPPEIIMRTDAIYNKVDAEAVVVYLVGRMLQEGLFLYNQNNPKTENIDPVDKKISHLIRRMLSIQPHKRPKIASVQKSIQSLCMEPEAYYKHECMLALQKLNEYQFSGQAWIKSFSEETLDNLSKESDLEQLISLSTNVQERLQPLLNNAIINAYKEKWAACMQRYHILLSSREFDADYDFMALQQEIMSFQAGETTDYANNFLFLKEKINQKYSALVTKTWHWLNNSRSMLDRMLHCQFDDDDMEVLTYIDEKSQLLVMNMQNIPQIKMIHSEIKDMLFHLETEDLKQIRLTIQELRLPKQTTFCGIAYFFSHKRQIAHFAANERKAETIVKTMRALPLSQRSQIRQVLDTVEPHTQKIFRQINWRQSASSTKVAPIF